ncbi:MAG TPA: nickel-dependent hydrogenase large subunit [Anaeromyxobacter sp.]|nr:nickel-dependent hydrogenase large subunit [Anaeromyxobacter sp.]
MSNRITVSPVTRVEGHLAVELEVSDTGRVVAAYASGTMFRGFESIMQGRDPRDAIHLTQRICGVCPIPHARAAVEAVERAYGVQVGGDAVLLRNLVQGAGLVSDHILHFYQLALLDYVQGPDLPPFAPALDADQRFSGSERDTLVAHYMDALEYRKAAQEMGTIFAGKLPHVMTFAPGGVTQQPTTDNVAKFRFYLDNPTNGLISFIENVYIPDVMRVAERYPEYFQLGAGPANLLSFGAFPDRSGKLLFAAGKYDGQGHVERPDQPQGAPQRGSFSALTDADVASIQESIAHAWYGPTGTGDAPNIDKPGAYSWVKAPRLAGDVYQVGSIARMIISGNYRGGVSVMDRLLASAYETGKVAAAMRGWLDGLAYDGSHYQAPASIPSSGSALALSEAPRAALAHWIDYSGGQVTRYRIITPTAWNASPRDDRQLAGPIEQSLLGVQIADRTQPIEVYRIIHSFDPCMGCAVHVTVID